MRIKRGKLDFELNYAEDAEENYKFSFKVSEFRNKHLPDLLNLFKLNYEMIEGDSYYDIPHDKEFGRMSDPICAHSHNYIFRENSKVANTIKYISNFDHDIAPSIILKDPVESIVNGTTYRMITGRNSIRFMASHMDRVYDYLDKYNFFNTYLYEDKNKTVGKFVISNIFTYEVLLIFILCSFSPKFPDMLEHGFFIDPKKVATYRLRMEKALPKDKKDLWLSYLSELEAEYKSNATIAFAQKLADGQVEKGEFNNITFTPHSATYQTVVIRSENLFQHFMAESSVINEFTIYDVVRMVAKEKAKKLEEIGTLEVEKTDSEGNEKTIRTCDPSAYTDGQIVLATFHINNIPIVLSKSQKSGHRKINGIRINTNEIEEVLFRTSCFQSEIDYTNFLKQTSILNLKVTDAIRDGIGLKIDKNYTDYGVYSDPKPHPESPKLFFKIIDKKVHLLIDNERTCPVKLNYLVKQVEMINRLTNGKDYKPEGYRYRYGIKDYNYAREKLKPILKAATTFIIKVKPEVKVDSLPVTVFDTSPIENVNLSITDDPIVNTVPETTNNVTSTLPVQLSLPEEITIEYLTDDDLKVLLGYIDLRHKEAIERSKEFLRIAVEQTEANLDTRTCGGITGEYYHVKGKLGEYYVAKETAKVFNARNGGYICIVNSSHNTGVGYDDVAARLYALRNDAMLIEEISTLKYLEVEAPVDDQTEQIPTESLPEITALEETIENVSEEIKKMEEEIIPA